MDIFTLEPPRRYVSLALLFVRLDHHLRTQMLMKVGAGGLDAAVPTGTVIGLFDDAGQADGCLVDYSIDDEELQA